MSNDTFKVQSRIYPEDYTLTIFKVDTCFKVSSSINSANNWMGLMVSKNKITKLSLKFPPRGIMEATVCCTKGRLRNYANFWYFLTP